MNAQHSPAASQRGMALITSLLLLLIITVLALSMFRSFGTQEKIAGNLREKERALHAAESAQQYGEWWLTQANNTATGAVAACPNAAPLNANAGQGQICGTASSQSLETLYGFAGITSPLPWAIQYTTFLPPGMSVTPGVNGANGDPPYFAVPGFYIADLGEAADGRGEAYEIDAYGYGGSNAAIAVVESTYEVTQGVTCRSCQ